MVSPVFNTLLEADPVKLAVMVPALKLPEASRATIALAVLASVAVVAELATLPAVLIVANLLSVIPAPEAISALTMRDVDTTPEPLVCSTPDEARGVKVMVPALTVRPANGFKRPAVWRVSSVLKIFSN